MTKTQDQELHESEEARRAYIAATFGSDALEGLATDQPRNGTRSSAERIGRQLQADERDQAEELALAGLHRDARERREDLALERARTLIDQGRTPDRATIMLAARAQERYGGSGLSSAARLAAPSLARLRREAQDNDHDRRQGRRPKGA
jgi:hypothetical protein